MKIIKKITGGEIVCRTELENLQKIVKYFSAKRIDWYFMKFIKKEIEDIRHIFLGKDILLWSNLYKYIDGKNIQQIKKYTEADMSSKQEWKSLQIIIENIEKIQTGEDLPRLIVLSADEGIKKVIFDGNHRLVSYKFTGVPCELEIIMGLSHGIEGYPDYYGA